jgi:hypothetical protein
VQTLQTSTLSPLSLRGSLSSSCRRGGGSGSRSIGSGSVSASPAGATANRGGDWAVFYVDAAEVPVLGCLISDKAEDTKMPVGRVS